jgi:hypothetical protein
MRLVELSLTQDFASLIIYKSDVLNSTRLSCVIAGVLSFADIPTILRLQKCVESRIQHEENTSVKKQQG